MEGKENITEYRDKLDKTLMSHDLSDVESLKILIKSQMSKSKPSEDQEYNDNLVQKRTKEVANFLSMLRSASTSAVERSKANEHGGWKIKHDNQDCRVMYREGPVGTPLHTLLAEGYVDGPLDVCMCISWEAGLYHKWWPQFSIPAFKVLSSECVKKIRTGEQVSLVRMKLSWPISAREALVHYVTLEYFQDGLIIVLLNTISETENIDESTHGFTKDGLPDEESVTRIDVVGGFAMQKVSANRSYFRTIVNIDVKLDFVPPTIINFVSRQLVGSGFKLFKKEVASLSKGDADFGKVLKGPFYSRIREALYSDNKVANGVSEQENIKITNGVLEEKDTKIIHELSEEETVKIVQPEEHFTPKSEETKDQILVSEIEEVEETQRSTEDNSDTNNNSSYSSCELYEHPTNKVIKDCHVIVGEKQVIISPEVNQALGTLEKVISVFREFGFNPRSLSLSRLTNNVFADLENNKANGSKRYVAPTKELSIKTSQESRNGFSSHSSRREMGLASREDHTSSSRGSHRSSFSFAINEAITSTLAEKNNNGELKNTDESGLSEKKMKKHRFCCINFTSGRLVA